MSLLLLQRNIRLYELVDFIDAHQDAGLISEPGPIRHEHCERLLDDGAIAIATVNQRIGM